MCYSSRTNTYSLEKSVQGEQRLQLDLNHIECKSVNEVGTYQFHYLVYLEVHLQSGALPGLWLKIN